VRDRSILSMPLACCLYILRGFKVDGYNMDVGRLLLILVGIGCGSISVSRLLALSAELGAIIGFILVFPAYLLACVCFDDKNERTAKSKGQ
jgi:hypothetical protein